MNVCVWYRLLRAVGLVTGWLSGTALVAQSLTADRWVDSVLTTMTEEQKIGQFFVLATFSNRTEPYYAQHERLVREQHVGGLLFFQGDPYTQATLTNRYQAAAKVPLLISLDAETGLGMRLDDAMTFPKQMTLGAITDDRLIYEMGREIGRQCRRIGVHLNFAPVIDVNSNPRNPIIGNRAFGETKDNVAAKGLAYARGLRDAGVLACAKHFPGHGDTETDSHHTLPQVPHDGTRLHALELHPFKALIADTVAGVLVGHLNVPALDSRPVAATLSDKIVTGLLKNELGFRGLVITDAMNMRGVTRSGSPEDANLQAVLAGNDLLLCAENITGSLAKIKDAIQKGLFSRDELDARVRKILRAKYQAGLAAYQPVDLTNLSRELNTPTAQRLRQELYENAVTVVRDDARLLPFRHLDTLRLAAVAIGAGPHNDFQRTLRKYAALPCWADEAKSDAAWFNEIFKKVDSTRTVIVSLHELSQKPASGYGITAATRAFVKRLAQRQRVVLCTFGNPYALKYFADVPGLVCAYEENDWTESATAQVLFGGLSASGRLPVSVDEQTVAGTGLRLGAIGRLGYALPEAVGMSSERLQQLDAVARSAVNQGAVPGCQVLVARRGKVVFQKNYGKLTYTRTEEQVRDTIRYDLASVTKVTATLQALMLLNEQGLIDLNRPAADYLPELRGSNKETILVRDLLLHQSGLQAYIPFWERTRTPDDFKPEFYARRDTLDFTRQVAPNLWTRPATRDSLWKWVIESPLNGRRDRAGRYSYVYSDLGLIMLWHVVEAVAKRPMEEFLAEYLYEPLGMTRTGFTPLGQGVPSTSIAPTEHDYRFRQAQLRGTVHDQNAALQGGVSGHAGLFSTANDLAILMQMNLQRGYYGGRQYFHPNTVPTFARTYSTRSARGLGWDKLPDNGWSNYISARASRSAFGHSGFTGTMVWADPEQDLVIIFLSNRVYPDANNTTLTSQRIRRHLMDAVYGAID
jgi:beta-glucosidase-like glycosyl hydrolase/CubicO group peptidase (beta-lactamase class C family)